MERHARNQDSRERILSIGERLILGRGFSAMGLTELLGAAEVPKGSFYHYFPSKEQFGVALLERYFDNYRDRIRPLFANGAIPATDRLLTYFDLWRELHAHSRCHETCLAVKLTGEVTDLSEPMRGALESGMDSIIQMIANVIREGQADGTVPAVQDPGELAESLYTMWLGASLRSKAKRNMDALNLAYKQTQRLLGVV